MSDKAESPLLRLPGELRKMIYKRVLCPQRVVNLVLKEPKDFELISPVPKLGEPKNPRESGPSLRIAGKPRLGRTLEVLQREKCVDTANHLRTYDISSAVLLACKLSYTEAAPLLYSENTFCVYAELLPFMYGMLASVGSINSHSIRFLHIHYFRAAIVDLWTGLMVDRNPLVELCRQLPGLQELKIWRPQEDLDDEFRDQNIVHVDLNDYHQASREAASRIFTLALQGVKSLKSTDFASGIVLAGPEHRYVRWITPSKEMQILADEFETTIQHKESSENNLGVL
ncbi:hypothetical protein MMC30_004797 [Trapelia coarctata]|nr:hypothetical protein [Trapelia coarctata]